MSAPKRGGRGKSTLPGTRTPPVPAPGRVPDSKLASGGEDMDVEKADERAPAFEIKDELAALITNDFAFDGVFAFSKQYPMSDAPNPCLSIEGVGPVGIPLGVRDAQAFSFSNEGICMVLADKISFGNTAWDSWVQNTVGDLVSKKLCLSGTHSFVLKKLLLAASGCHCIEGMVGCLLIVLPSAFEGGQLEAYHDGRKKTFKVAADSGMSTSIVAGYADAQLTHGSVTSGHCFILLYDIIQAPNAPRCALPDMTIAAQKLRRLLQSWKQSAASASTTPSAPTHLACVLRGKYKKGLTFSSSSLKGADAMLLRYLSSPANELGFSLHLAHVEGSLRISSHVAGYDPYDSDYADEDEFDDDLFVDEGEDDAEEVLEVKQVVDLGGMPVCVDELKLLIYDHGGHEAHRAAYICGPVIDRSREPDSNKFEKDELTSATRTKTWRRTVLFIWQTDSDIQRSVCSGDMYAYALDLLGKSTTTIPTPRERTIADSLIARLDDFKHPVKKKHADDEEWFYLSEKDKAKAKKKETANVPKAVTLLRECAQRWNDAAMFLRVLAVCEAEQDISVVGSEGLASACQVFGWDTLKDFCTMAITKDPTTTRRSGLLLRLARLAVENNNSELGQWCTDQENNVLRTLGKTVVGHIPWFIDLTLSRGGDILSDIILPHLASQKLGLDFWAPFLTQLHQKAPFTRELVAQRVRELVSSFAAFPVITVKDRYGDAKKQADSASILKTVQLCIDTAAESLAAEVFSKMRKAARSGEYSPYFPPWMYYAELSPPVVKCIESMANASVLVATFRPFFEDVVRTMLSMERKSPKGATISSCPLSQQQRAIAVSAARKAGGAEFIKTVTPAVLQGRDPRIVEEIVRALAVSEPSSDPTPTAKKRSATDDAGRAAVGKKAKT
ncbi:hypothetical protein C8F01DRAFT_1088639 [Mycena amicta]|nr:hypothetical protein C8F01DRAFT_1088639 [Mycena amicta]